MRGNTISIELPLKRGKVSKTIPLYQYDYGQKLIITGAELPEYYEVHFSNEMHGDAVTSIGDSTGVLIPDALLATGENVYLWLYLHADSDDGETEFQGAIPVIKRAHVTDQTPTPAEQSVITQAIAALTAASAEATEAKEDAEAAQQHIENMGVAATTLPTDSDATVTKTVNSSGEVTLTFGLPRGVKGDHGDRGLQGETGNDGEDGEDGFSPVVSLTKSGKVTTFSVTDAGGTYSVEINDGEDGNPGQDATPDLITVDYSDLTFPVAAGTMCYHSGLLYKANQAIATSEEWTAAHWTQTTIEAEHHALKTEINSAESDVESLREVVVSDVKMAVKPDDVPISTSNGYLNAETGLLVSTNSGKCTDFIEVPDGCVSVNGKAFLYHEYGVAFYDSEKSYISGIEGYDGTSSTQPQAFNASVPENAKYIRWSLNVSDSTLPDDFGFAYIVLSTTKNITISKAGASIPLGNNGYIDATNGTLASSGAAKSTDYVEIPSSIGGRVKGKACLYNNFGIAFYDYTKVFLSGVSGTSTGQSSLSPQSFDIEIPETAKFMRWCLVVDNSQIPADFAVDFIVPVQTDIIDVTNDIRVLKNTKINASTGATEENGYWITTDYIQVTDIPKVSVQVAINEYTGIAFYDANRTYVSGVWGYSAGETSSLVPKTKRFEIPDGVHYIRTTLCVIEKPYAQKDFGILFFGVNPVDRKIIQYVNESAGNEAHNILILGDSYSRLGDWINGLCSGLNVAEIINLGVVSATVRDRYADRTTYPYTSRPTSTGTGNQNTIASQVQKVKRLKTGTDLDSGEVKIYSDHSPDVIIIEGGMNDWYDNETKENAYPQQFISQVNNVYYKNSAGNVVQGNYHIKTDIETVDRTSFAGAYRFIVEELLTLFPDAQIFIVTASRFNYFVDNPQIYDKIAEQQIKCARYCGATVIDWNGEGNISTITDFPAGSGTQEDPYTVYYGTKNTTDGLHPNKRGGRTYGRLAANVIKQRFANIGKQG